MQIQVNSDKTITVDANLTQAIEADVTRLLGRFEKKLTRVEIHLSDVDNKKTGKPDKRCLIEVRPAGDQPRSASAITPNVESSVREAAGKMQRSLTTFFGRRGRPAQEISAPAASRPKPAARKSATGAARKRAAKKTAKQAVARKTAKLSPRGPKKKGIYQARRKSRPTK